jgi:hypothetical protein
MLEVFVVAKNGIPDCAFETEGGAEAYCETMRRAEKAEWQRAHPGNTDGDYAAEIEWTTCRLEMRYV